MEGNPRRLDGRMRRVENTLRDYRKVDGVLIPFVSESKVETAPQTRKMTVDKVVLNPQLQDGLFGKPMVAAGGNPAAGRVTADNAIAHPPAAAAAAQ